MTWPGRTDYRAQVVVDPHADGEVKLLTVPPIHAALLRRRANGSWEVTWVSMPLRSSRVYGTQLSAIREAAAVISQAAGRDWREKFVGVQRLAIGQQQCPKLINDLGKRTFVVNRQKLGQSGAKTI